MSDNSNDDVIVSHNRVVRTQFSACVFVSAEHLLINTVLISCSDSSYVRLVFRVRVRSRVSISFRFSGRDTRTSINNLTKSCLSFNLKRALILFHTLLAIRRLA